MTIDHEAFAEANVPPPARVVETPEVEEAQEATEAASPVEPAKQPVHDTEDVEDWGPTVPDVVPEAIISSMRALALGTGRSAKLVHIVHRVDIDGLRVVTRWSVQDEDRTFHTVRCGATHMAGDNIAYVQRLT